MALFEILIPKSAKIPVNMTMRVEAESWIEALKAGRQKMGESSDVTDNVLVDIKEDNSIHVTDAGTGRVFKISEIGAEPAEEQETIEDRAATEPEMQTVTQQDVAAAAPVVEAESPAEPEPQLVTEPPPPEPQVAAQLPVRETPPTEERIGRAIEPDQDPTADLIEDVFEKTEQVYEKPDKESALYFMLDLAMEKIQADSGSVLLADINAYDLFFGAARGPKADQVMSFRLKMGQGIVGFCAEEGVGLAISDVSKDPRFYSAVSDKIGYPTRSILCVPMESGGQVYGALELINRKENDTFSEQDLNIANFIANQIAQYLMRQHK